MDAPSPADITPTTRTLPLAVRRSIAPPDAPFLATQSDRAGWLVAATTIQSGSYSNPREGGASVDSSGLPEPVVGAKPAAMTRVPR